MAAFDDGNLQLEFRLQIEGWPYEFVSSPAMEQTYGGRVRVAGLMRQGLSWSENVSPAEALLEGDGMTVSIVDRQKDGAVTTALASAPTVTTWLSANLTAAATTMSVMSNTGWAAGDYVHAGTEAILLGDQSGAAAGTLINLTRAQWDTIAQKHYTSDGDQLVRTPVTNKPSSVEGRRARLYVYGNTHALTGAGQQVFYGICSTDAALAEDGSTWTITIDPIHRLLDQDMGSDMAEPCPARGYYFHDGNPFTVTVFEGTKSINLSIPGNATWISAGVETIVSTTDDGDTMFETLEDLCAAVNSIFAALITAASLLVDRIEMVPGEDAAAAWQFRVTTDSASVSQVAMLTSTFNPPALGTTADGYGFASARIFTIRGIPFDDGTLATNSVYIFRPEVSYGAPLGIWNSSDHRLPVWRPGGPYAGTPPSQKKIFVGGQFTFTAAWGLTASGCAIEWPDGEKASYEIVSTNAATRSMVLSGTGDQQHLFAGASPKITFLRRYATGNIMDFVGAIVIAAPTYSGVGAVPFITVFDFDTTDMETVLGSPEVRFSWQDDRLYAASSDLSFLEVLTHEMRLNGLYPIITDEGLISWRRLALPVATSPAAVDFTSDNTLVDQGFPTWERNGLFGSINTVKVRLDYQVASGKWEGTTYAIRDQAAFGRRKIAREIEIAPRSADPWGWTASSAIRPPYEQLVQQFSTIFGIFASDYAIIRLDAPLADGTTDFISTTLGTFCTVTSDHIPDVSDGTRGITALPGIIVGRRVQLDAGRVSFTILATYRKVSGYTPCLAVTANALVSGNRYDLTVSKDAHFDSIPWMDAADSIADHFVAGDQVKVQRWDQTTAGTLAGEVVTVTPGTSTIRVQFDSAWTPGAYNWILMYDDAGQADASQTPYVYMASGSTGRVAFATPSHAFEWG